MFGRLIKCPIAAPVPLQRNGRLASLENTNNIFAHGELHTAGFLLVEQSETPYQALCMLQHCTGVVYLPAICWYYAGLGQLHASKVLLTL